MYNNWLTIGNFTVHGYGVMIGIGILGAFFLSEKLAKKNGLNADIVDNLIYVALICGWICAKILYCIVNWYDFIENPLAYLGSSGWVVYGGIIGGLVGMYIYCRKKKVNFFDYLNILVIAVALAQGFGRIGCFFAGCCYGIETTSSLGVTFPKGSLAPAGVKLLPTQLIMAWGDFFICGILYRTYEEKKTRKYNMMIYLLLYSLGRFAVEFIRGDAERGSVGPLSTSQFIAILVAVCTVIGIFVYKNWLKNHPEEEAVPEVSGEEEHKEEETETGEEPDETVEVPEDAEEAELVEEDTETAEPEEPEQEKKEGSEE